MIPSWAHPARHAQPTADATGYRTTEEETGWADAEYSRVRCRRRGRNEILTTCQLAAFEKAVGDVAERVGDRGTVEEFAVVVQIEPPILCWCLSTNLQFRIAAG